MGIRARVGAVAVVLVTSVEGVVAADNAIDGSSNWIDQLRPSAGPRVNSLPGYGFGSASDAGVAEKVVKVDGTTRWINVNRGDTVTVANVENRKHFTWRFDTMGTTVFELGKIAPKDFGTGHTQIFVGPGLYDSKD